MKIKTIILIAVCAAVTFSFTFASIKGSETKEVSNTKTAETAAADAPAGGFVAEEKF